MEEKDLNKMLDEVEEECGHYCWINDNGDTVEIQCVDCMANAVEDIIESNGYEIEDESDFCGSDYDGVTFTVRK